MMNSLTESKPLRRSTRVWEAADDRQIVAEARKRLRERDFRFTRAVSCEFHEGVLMLRGTVPSYHLKQLAQTAVARIPGVLKIDNRVCVFSGCNAGCECD